MLRRACAFDPADRYPSAVELDAALTAAFRKLEQERAAPRRKRRRPAAPVPTPFAVGMDLFRPRHGRALGMRFHCRRCNGPIAEAMHVCPWCGTKDNSFAEITRPPLICPHCERGVLALRARRASRVDQLPVVLGRALPRQRPATPPGPARDAALHASGLRG